MAVGQFDEAGYRDGRGFGEVLIQAISLSWVNFLLMESEEVRVLNSRTRK